MSELGEAVHVPHPPSSSSSLGEGHLKSDSHHGGKASPPPHHKPSSSELCLSHHKHDSGSYDGPSDLSKNSSYGNHTNGPPPSEPSPVTILISNGDDTRTPHLSTQPPEPSTQPPEPSTKPPEPSIQPPDSSIQPPTCGGDSSSTPPISVDPRRTQPPRTTSSASVYSEGRGSTCQSSSSSSFDLSQASSHYSRDLLEQLVAAPLEGEAMERNEIVKQLLEHIVTLKLELEELKLENVKLKGVRNTMDDELSVLTENLFEEAYKMVDSAKEDKGVAVKKLADAAGKIDAMETEMSALKNLLHTPSNHCVLTDDKNPHPKHRKSVKKALKKLTRKVKLQPSKSASNEVSIPLTLVEHKNEIKGAALKEGEMMPDDFSEFSHWLSMISCEEDHPYLDKVVEVDVIPCLRFKDDKLSSCVLTAARKNDLLMESLGPCTEGEDNRVCALSDCVEVSCTHRMKLGSSDQWLYISQQCRDRIAAACDFYMFIGHIEKGILKLEASQLYWQVSRLRAMMTLARLTLCLPC